MLNPDPDFGNDAIELFVFRQQLFATGFLLGLNDDDAIHNKALKASVLKQTASFWESVTSFISDLFVVLLPFAGVAQENDFALAIADDKILDGVLFFLPL